MIDIENKNLIRFRGKVVSSMDSGLGVGVEGLMTITDLLELLSQKPFFDDSVQAIFDGFSQEIQEAFRRSDLALMNAQLSNKKYFADETKVVRVVY